MVVVSMTWGGLGGTTNTKWYTASPTYCIIMWQPWVEFKQYSVVYFKPKLHPTKWLESSTLPNEQYSSFSDLCNTGQTAWSIKHEAEIKIRAFLASCGQTTFLTNLCCLYSHASCGQIGLIAFHLRSSLAWITKTTVKTYNSRVNLNWISWL